MRQLFRKAVGFHLLIFFLSCFLVLGPICATAADKKKGPVVYVSYGGSYQKVEEKAYLEKFEAKTGVKYLSVSPTDYGKLKAMVKAEQVEWDVVNCGGGVPVLMYDFLEPLDYTVINTEGLPKQYIFERGVAINTYSEVVGWNTEAFKEGPESWADFWDVKKFPGPRAMYNQPGTNLEAALMADGVAPEDVYPLTPDKVERAYKKLDEIKPHVKVWWTSGAQPAQLLADGEVVLATAWNGRLSNIIKEGAPVAFDFNPGFMHFGCGVVPKGTPNKELAMQLLNQIISAESQAEISRLYPYGGVNAKAYDLLDPEVARSLNSHPDNLTTQLIYDEAWWGTPANREPAEERWKEWLLQ